MVRAAVCRKDAYFICSAKKASDAQNGSSSKRERERGERATSATAAATAKAVATPTAVENLRGRGGRGKGKGEETRHAQSERSTADAPIALTAIDISGQVEAALVSAMREQGLSWRPQDKTAGYVPPVGLLRRGERNVNIQPICLVKEIN